MFSENGWIDQTLFMQWVNQCFIPYAYKNRVSDTKPIILFVDGHDSHETVALRRLVYNESDRLGIEFIIICFPSKCTHMLQPLDVLIYKQVKAAWLKHCDKVTVKEGKKIGRYNFIDEYMAEGSGHEAIKDHLCVNSFRKTGIHPVDRTVFPESAFAPSHSTSSRSHVPSSCPDEIPSSDPAIPTDAEDCSDDDSDSDLDYMDQEDDGHEINYENTQEESDSELEVVMDGSDGEDNEEMVDAAQPIKGQAVESSADSRTMPIPVPQTPSYPTRILSSLPDSPIRTRSQRIRSMGTPLPPLLSTPADIAHLATQSHQELQEEVLRLQHLLQSTQHQLTLSQRLHRDKMAQHSAAAAHCTIMGRENALLKDQLASARRKSGKSTKIKGRVITGQGVKASFVAEEADKARKDAEAAAKEQDKKTQDEQRAQFVSQEAITRVFSALPNTHTKKVDLQILATALGGISTKATNKELLNLIQQQLAARKDQLRLDSRFAGLYPSTHSSSAPNDARPLPPLLDHLPLANLAFTATSAPTILYNTNARTLYSFNDINPDERTYPFQ